MKIPTKRKTDPEKVLKAIRQMIEEVEEAYSKRGDDALDTQQISELKDKIQGGLNRLREHYSQLGGRVSDYYSEAENRLRGYYDEVEDRIRHGAETTDETLRAHPYQMATITFGLGIVVGALLRMGRSD